jgi:hypothetical protein
LNASTPNGAPQSLRSSLVVGYCPSFGAPLWSTGAVYITIVAPFPWSSLAQYTLLHNVYQRARREDWLFAIYVSLHYYIM